MSYGMICLSTKIPHTCVAFHRQVNVYIIHRGTLVCSDQTNLEPFDLSSQDTYHSAATCENFQTSTIIMLVRLPVSSNVVNAIYVVIFDLLLQGVLSWLVQVFLSSENIRDIYDRRTQFSLSSTRLAIVSHQGLSRKRIGRSIAVYSAAIVLLAIAGNFSIDGTSTKTTREKTVPVLVTMAAPNELIDFTKHVSADGKLATDTFLAVNGAVSCYDTNNNTFLRYPGISNLRKLSKSQWSPVTTSTNCTCLTKVNGYKETKIEPTPFLKINIKPELCKPKFRVIGKEAIAQATVELEGECHFKALNAWCATSPSRTCVALLKVNDCYTLLFEHLRGSNRTQSPVKYCRNEKIQDVSLRSMVHLLDTKAAPFLWWISYVIFLKPIPNGKVIEYVKEKNETEVDISFLLATLGIALLLMVAFAAVTGHNWRSYVLKPERTDCNPFHSTSDMLSFTALEAQGGNERRFIEQGGIFVFLSQDYLHIKPDLEGDKFVP